MGNKTQLVCLRQTSLATIIYKIYPFPEKEADINYTFPKKGRVLNFSRIASSKFNKSCSKKYMNKVCFKISSEWWCTSVIFISGQVCVFIITKIIEKNRENKNDYIIVGRAVKYGNRFEHRQWRFVHLAPKPLKPQ